jgi:biotin carboxylase
MDVKILMIIGAGPNQIPAIKLAKERGLRVVVTDMDPEAEGFALADRYGLASTRDVESTIAFAREVHREIGLDGVMTIASESGYTVARVAEALGLPGLSPDAAWKAAHKVDRQKCFLQHRVPSPHFTSASSIDEGIERASEIGWPVVVKPADSAGSRGVQKVNNQDEMAQAVSEIRSYSKLPEFLIEEFLTGTEHSIEGIVIDGEVHWTGFSDRNYDKKEVYLPYFLEDGDTLPTTLSDEMLERVKLVSTDAVRALGIDWGPCKGDILIDNDGPKVLEMAARLSGDYFCYETVPLHNGINLLQAVMDLSLGIDIDTSQLQPKFNRGVALRYVWPKPGVVRDIKGLEEVCAMPGIRFFNWEPRWRSMGIGTVVTAATSMGERVGSVMSFADTREEAVRLAEKAVSMIEIVTE